jgi:P4 family phage/plasmid primase-like protien
MLNIVNVESKFDGMIQFENVNMRNLNLLLCSDILNEEEKKQLIQYKMNYDKKKEMIKVLYEIPNKCCGFGRVYAKNNLSFIGLKKEIRHALSIDNYVDIDMKNAQPTILEQICKKNNIECKYLSKYVDNRDDILKEVMEIYKVPRDQAKELFIIIMYYGSFNKWCEINGIKGKEMTEFIKNFQKGIQKTGEIIYKNNDYLKDKLKRENNNEIGTIMSFYLQEYERRIMEVVYEYLLENKKIVKDVSSLCHDGIMIEKKYYNVELLDKIQNVVLFKIGIKIIFEEKPIINEYEKQLQEIEKESKKFIENIGDDVIFNKYAKNNFKNFYKTSNKEYYIYNDDNKLFEIKDYQYATNYIGDEMRTLLIKYKHIFTNQKDYEDLFYGYTNGMDKKILKLNNDYELKNKLNKKKGMIPLKENKVLNLYDLSIRERSIDDYFTFEMPVSYIPDTFKEEAIKKYLNDLFLNDEELIQTVLDIVKTILYGQSLRYIFVFQGAGSNGKSLFIEMLQKIYSNFASTISKKIIIEEKTNSALNTEIEMLEHIRVGLLSETKDGDIFNDVIIKKITGGDQLTLRGLQVSERNFYTNVSLIVCTNHFPKFDTTQKNMLERIIPIPFLQSFETNDNYKNEMLNLTNDFFTYFIKYGNLKRTYSNLCQSIKNCINKQIEVNNTFKDFFDTYYKITENENDFVSNSEFKMEYKEWCKINNIASEMSQSQYLNNLKSCGVNWDSIHKNKNRGYRYIKPI